MKAADVTTPVLQRYIEKRFADVDAMDTAAVLKRNGSINRELAVLSSAFSMAYDMQPRLVPSKLHFKRLTESPARKGFIDESGYQRLIRACPHVWMKALLCIGFRTGMRRGEVLALNVEDVDMRAGTIRIRKSKNGEPRTVPFIFDMKQHIVPMLEGKKPTDKVFTRTRPATHQNPNGRIVPVANFQSEWGKATEQAGLNITFHDLRRSAVRAMSLAGLDQVEAMRISGHKTNSMFVRYNIVDESRLRDAAAKIDAFAAIERKRAEAESQARVSARVDAESTDMKTPEVLQ